MCSNANGIDIPVGKDSEQILEDTSAWQCLFLAWRWGDSSQCLKDPPNLKKEGGGYFYIIKEERKIDLKKMLAFH